MKKIVEIGFEIPKEDNNSIDLRYNISLSDYDIAIINPDINTTHYQEDGEYQGVTKYSKSSSNSLRKSTIHWNDEINRFLESGKNIFVILSKKSDFFIHTGKKEFSGTGRNRIETNFVTDFNNYKFLPIEFKIKNSEGKVLLTDNPITKLFYEDFKDYISYVSHLDETFEKKDVLFRSKNRDKVLGALKKHLSGNIIFFPYIDFHVPNLMEYDDEHKPFWNDDAIKVGRRFIQHIVKIDKSVKGGLEKTPAPDWSEHKNYTLTESVKIKKEIDTRIEPIQRLKDEINKFKIELEEEDQLRGLLYETGKSLEKSVIIALNLLGYKAENYNDGTLELDQIIISPKGKRYVGECEGKDNKDIDVNKFRQLLYSLNEDFQREEVEEKAFGILFGNPQRFIVPSKRTLDFTKKCKKGAEREKIALIKTVGLFKVAKYIRESKDIEFAEKCRETIHSNLGKVVKFPPLPKRK